MSATEQWVPVTPGRASSVPPDRPDREVSWNWWGPAPETRQGREPFDPTKVAHVLTGFVAVAVLGLIFYGAILGPLLVHLGLMQGHDATVTAAGLQAGLFENAVTMLGLPLLWVAVFYRDGIKAVAWRLHLRTIRPGREILLGIGTGLGLIVISMIVSALFMYFVESPPNEVVQDLARILTWPLVVLLAVVSGTTEEVFFRGFLQNRIGIVPTNILFGFAHLAYGTPLQVVVPLALGFVFSALVIRTRSLVPAIVAHMVFNGVQLALAKWVVESGLA